MNTKSITPVIAAGLLLCGCGVFAVNEDPAAKPTIPAGTTPAAGSTAGSAAPTVAGPTTPGSTGGTIPDNGTRDNPIPIGTAAEIGSGWTVTINSVNLNANDLVAQAYEYNDPPPDGKVYVLVNLTATYNGEDSSPAGVDIAAVGQATNTVSDGRSGDGLAKPPEPEYDQYTEVFAGAVTEGNVVLSVPTADIDTLVLIARQSYGGNDSQRKFFAAR